MRYFITLVVLTLSVATASAQTPAEHITTGDRAYAALAAEAALGSFEKAIETESRSYEALWKASRSAVDIGSYTPDASRRKALFTKAEKYARSAIAANPSRAEGYFTLSLALGKAALTQSPRGRVRFATEIRAQALQCLEIAPAHAGCLHVMGMWNAEVMRLNSVTRMVARNILGGRVFGSASWKEAVRYMEASVAAEPDRIVHRVDVAAIYADIGDTARARAEFETALRLPVTDVNDRTYQAQARDWLAARR